MKFLAFSVGLVLVLCFAALALEEKKASVVNNSATPTPDAKAVAAASNAFAFDLFARVAGNGGNVFYSPTSLTTALAMAYAGAQGDTAAEMAKVLHFNLPPGQLHPAFANLAEVLNDTGGKYQLAVANALWTQKGFPLLPGYLEIMKRDYQAGENAVDFAGNVEMARQTINRWVETQTKERIKNLISQGALTPDCRLVLTNAIYFKADWQYPFEKEATYPQDFESRPGSAKKVDMMHSQRFVRYGENAAGKWIELPYKGGNLSMVLVLPTQRHKLADVEQGLKAAALEQWLAGMQQQRVALALPKFRMDTAMQLASVLGKLGMPQAFSPATANFTAMANVPGQPLFIGDVIHKAFVQVDELGTEAAAATAITMRAGSAMNPEKPKEFICDQPFLCLIRDQRTGAILFLGRVSEPGATEK